MNASATRAAAPRERNGGQILVEQLRIQGVIMGASPFVRDIPRFAAMYMRGQLDLDGLIGERISLGEVNEAIDVLKSGLQARSVITF